jgi:hypothetical protein
MPLIGSSAINRVRFAAYPEIDSFVTNMRCCYPAPRIVH